MKARSLRSRKRVLSRSSSASVIKHPLDASRKPTLIKGYVGIDISRWYQFCRDREIGGIEQTCLLFIAAGTTLGCGFCGNYSKFAERFDRARNSIQTTLSRLKSKHLIRVTYRLKKGGRVKRVKTVGRMRRLQYRGWVCVQPLYTASEEVMSMFKPCLD